MLDAYVAHGLVERDDVLSLACDPQDEAEFYRSAQAHGAFGRLGELDLPVTLMAGERSESHPRELMRVLSSRIRSSELQIVPDAGHFLPMQCPEVMVGWLQQHLPC